MANIIIFEKNGEVNLATLINEQGRLCRQNLTNIVPCPEELLQSVPKKIVDFCKETAPHYLYRNFAGSWESIQDSSTE